MYYLVTGSAGFIGFHLSKNLLEKGLNVIGVDNLNEYYDVNLKKSRLKILKDSFPHRFIFLKFDLESKEEFFRNLDGYDIQFVINLAAQAGVRYSL